MQGQRGVQLDSLIFRAAISTIISAISAIAAIFVVAAMHEAACIWGPGTLLS